jgi:hypothetical protein
MTPERQLEIAQREIRYLRDENGVLEKENDTLHHEIYRVHDSYIKDGVWRWQGDEGDHLESLTCNILITPSQMRGVLAMPSPERDAGTAREGIEDLLIGEGLPEADWVNVRITEAYRRGLANSKLGVHLSHCNFGENAGVCKYGESDCPALADSWAWLGEALQNRSTPLPATREPAAAPGIVERMQRAHNDTFSFALVTPGSTLNPDLAFKAMNAALTVAQKERDDQWEASIKTQYYSAECGNLGFPAYIQAIKDRLLAPAAQMDPRVSRIKTSHVFPPIPIRDFDWVAWIDGEEEGWRGHGKTEQDAINELNSQLAEHDEENTHEKL